MRAIRLSDRLLLAGQTGKGKTTLMQFIVDALQPVRTIVFDPKGMQQLGVIPCRTPDQLEHRIRRGDPLLHYIPASFERDQLEEACRIVWNTPGPYIWVVDDVNELTGPNYCPAGLRLGVTQGREPRKMIIALTQRLAECHPVFRSQSEHLIIFTPAPVELDLKAIAGNVGYEWRALDAELRSLHEEQGDYSHLWYVRDTHELRRCAPIELGASPGAPGRAAETPGESGLPTGAPAGGAAESAPCEESDSGSGRSSRSP